MQEMIDASVIEVCGEEGVYPEQVFLFCCFLYHNVYSRKNLSKGVEKNKKQCQTIFSGDHSGV